MGGKTTFHIRVGKRIKELRESCGETLDWLSRKTGLSANILKSIEKGNRDAKVDELFRISNALNIRLSAFLDSRDYKLYYKRKEEKIDCYISLDDLSQLLDISPRSIKELCHHSEIPYSEMFKKYYFRASEINAWLRHHCGSKRKIAQKQIDSARMILGIEPLVSAKIIAELLGISPGALRSLQAFLPHYRIGRHSKFRISEIEGYIGKHRVELWEISTGIGNWRTSFVKPCPTTEQDRAREASWEKKYDERARPGYIIRIKMLESPDLEELKKSVQAFIDLHITSSCLLGCRYHFEYQKRIYSCELKWWGLPDGRDNFRVHSAGLSAESPNEVWEKARKFRELKIKPEDFIREEYYTFGASFMRRCHHARITYYLPRVTNKMGDGKKSEASEDAGGDK